jgi:hypothetical protein
MSDQPDNMVIEQLRHIRATGDKTHAKLTEVEGHLIELRLQVAGLVREDAALYAKLAQYEARFERIEARLGLAD